MLPVKSIATWCSNLIELVGIGIITGTTICVIVLAFIRWIKHWEIQQVYHDSRKFLGQGILLGLEFLVAADIIRTVAVELSFATIGVLAIVVLIRTFLSYSLEVELTGSWPWQKESSSKNE